MSNHVYGYLDSTDPGESTVTYLQEIARKYGLGLLKKTINDMHNFPESVLPVEPAQCLFVSITDSPETNVAEYLIDFIDYAEEADIGLPLNGSERLSLLVNLLTEIMSTRMFPRLVLAMTQCNEIESVEKLRITELAQQLDWDFRNYAPPNKIYVVT